MSSQQARISALIQRLHRDMGTVVSVIERKRDLNGDERAQVARLCQWQFQLDELSTLLREPPREGWQPRGEQGEIIYPCGCSRLYCPTHKPAYVPDARETDSA